MKIEIDAYQLLISKRLDTKEITECKGLIEKTGMSGNIPRPLVPLNVAKNMAETIISIVGNVGNYHDVILSTISKEFNTTTRFISDEHAQGILDDIDNNFLEYL